MMLKSLVAAALLSVAHGQLERECLSLALPCADYVEKDTCEKDPGLNGRCVWDSRCKCGLESPTDVIFLFDRNDNSLSEELFEEQREWVAEAIYDSIPPESRVGIIEYADDASDFMTLEWSTDKTVEERRDRALELFYEVEVPYSVTGAALDKALEMFSVTANSGVRRQVIVVITTQKPTCDGCAADDSRITPCTRNPQLEGIRVVTLAGHTTLGGLDAAGVAALQCLDDSTEDHFQEFNGFGASTWKFQVKPTINAGTCPVEGLPPNDCPERLADVAYVIDSSSSIEAEDFATQLSWVGAMIISSLPRVSSRVAFVRFATDSEILRTFPQSGAGTREEDYMESLLIDQNRGLTNTYEAMLDAIELFEEVENEAERRRIMVLLTDGEPNPENPLLCSTKARFEELGVTTIVLIIGEDSIEDKVQCLADHIYTVPDFSCESMLEIGDFVIGLTCYPPTTTTETPTSTATPTTTPAIAPPPRYNWCTRQMIVEPWTAPAPLSAPQCNYFQAKRRTQAGDGLDSLPPAHSIGVCYQRCCGKCARSFKADCHLGIVALKEYDNADCSGKPVDVEFPEIEAAVCDASLKPCPAYSVCLDDERELHGVQQLCNEQVLLRSFATGYLLHDCWHQQSIGYAAFYGDAQCHADTEVFAGRLAVGSTLLNALGVAEGTVCDIQCWPQ